MISFFKLSRKVFLLVFMISLAACATKDLRHVPVPLKEIKSQLTVKPIWKTQIAKTNGYAFEPIVIENAVYAAGANGTVGKFDVSTGNEIWRTRIKANLTAGVGSDGAYTVVGGSGLVFALDNAGKELWKAKVDGEVFSPPLVGEGYAIVRTIDGKITAFDIKTGEKKWIFNNVARSLNLRVITGMRFAGPNAILAGFPGGSLAVIDLATGESFWQTPLSFPQGITEVERINDIAGSPTLVERRGCAVSFQGKIGCFDVERGNLQWSQPFSSIRGLAQDEQSVVASNDQSIITRFDANTGQTIWENSELKNRGLNSPINIGPVIAVGDYQGFIHFLARDTGELIGRVNTDKSAINVPFAKSDNILIVQTQNGGLYAFEPS